MAGKVGCDAWEGGVALDVDGDAFAAVGVENWGAGTFARTEVVEMSKKYTPSWGQSRFPSQIYSKLQILIQI